MSSWTLWVFKELISVKSWCGLTRALFSRVDWQTQVSLWPHSRVSQKFDSRRTLITLRIPVLAVLQGSRGLHRLQMPCPSTSCGVQAGAREHLLSISTGEPLMPLCWTEILAKYHHHEVRGPVSACLFSFLKSWCSCAVGSPPCRWWHSTCRGAERPRWCGRMSGCGSRQHQVWSGSSEELTVKNQERSGGCFDVDTQLD